MNINPSVQFCIFSTLLFAVRQAQNLKTQMPCIIFDQPVFIKAFEITKTEDICIVVPFGGFHLLMYLLRGTGKFMEGLDCMKLWR